MSSFIENIKAACNQHKLVRRLLLLWAMVMITITLERFWDNLASFANPTTVVLAVIGLLSIVLGFYQWSRDKDDAE